MAGWHHQLNGHEFQQTPEDSEGQGNQACCNVWLQRVGHNLATEQQQEKNTSSKEPEKETSRGERKIQKNMVS